MEDPVYSFHKLFRHIDLKRYLTGRPGHDGEKRFNVILFAFMEEGYQALREIEKLCRTDIRFLCLLDGAKSFILPS